MPRYRVRVQALPECYRDVRDPPDERPIMATGGSAQMRGFATGVGANADIGGPPLPLII